MRCKRVRCIYCKKLDYIDKMEVAIFRPLNRHDKRLGREAYRHIHKCWETPVIVPEPGPVIPDTRGLRFDFIIKDEFIASIK